MMSTFRDFAIIHFWRKAWLTSEQTNPLHQCCIVPSLLSIGQVVLKMFKSIFHVVNVIFLISLFFPLEKGLAYYLNKQSFSRKDALFQLCLNFSQCLWRRRVFKCFQCMFAILPLSPLEKKAALHLINFEFPLPQKCFVSTLVKIGPVLMEKKFKYRRIDEGQWTIRKGHLSLQLRWAKKRGKTGIDCEFTCESL